MQARITTLLASFALLSMATGAIAQIAPLQPVTIGASTTSIGQLPPDMTRAEAVAIIVEGTPEFRVRLDWYRKYMPPLPLFADVRQEDWFAPYLEVAFEQGIVTGNPGPDGNPLNATFRPSDALLTEEAAALASRTRELSDNGGSQSVILQLPGSSSDAWFNSPINTALSYGIQLPFPIRAGLSMTRSEFNDMVMSIGIENAASIAQQLPRQQINTFVAIHPQQYVPSVPVQTAVGVPAPAASKNFSITMPSLGISDLNITHPTDAFTPKGLLDVLQNGVGHLFSYPGKGGKILVYGHSSGYAWDVSKFTKIFRGINKLKTGDLVYVNYSGKTYTYKVTGQSTIAANDMSIAQGSGEELILYTCWPPDSTSQRLIVRASPVEATAQQ